jgi:hypothetical protein
MGKKKNKMKKEEAEIGKKENEPEVKRSESIDSKLEINKMRSSAEIEDDDNVVHDEESPRN